MKHYILMADIIDSQDKPQNVLMNHFKMLVDGVNTKYLDKVLSPLTITLGDEFQGIVKDLKSAIDIIFFIEEECIRKNAEFKCRYVLKHGEIDTPINHKMAYEMLGEGLTMARKSLNHMKSENNRFYIELEDAEKSEAFNEAFNVYAQIISAWNLKRDYQLIATFIEEIDYKIVAETLGRDRSSVWRRNDTLKMESYFSIKKVINYLTK